MLVGLKELLAECQKNRVAVPAFNVYNLETVLAVGEAAKNLSAPVIYAFGEGYMDDVPMPLIAEMVRYQGRQTGQPVVLHLDHAKELSSIQEAIDCGFTSVMYDGSHLNFEENLRNTKEVVKMASKLNVSVEGELGYLNPEDGSAEGRTVNQQGFTDPEQAYRYVTETGVDALAIAIGNAHGLYKGVPRLDFGVLKQIASQIKLPLVLHGSSGIPGDQLKKAVEMGICKINVNTELALGAVESIRKSLADYPSPNSLRYEALIRRTRKDLVELAEKFICLTSWSD